jgi:hypothetical protein
MLAGARSAVNLHQQQSDDHGDVADGIGGKAPAFSDSCHQNSGYGWTDDARAVEHRGIQRDGVHQIFFADHVDEEGLAAGDIEGVHHSEEGREHEDMPYLDASGQRERSQNSREDHGSGLSGDDEPLAIDAVGGDSSQGSDDENGKLTGEADASQQERRVRHSIDEPCLGHGLHPGADQGDELSAEKELKVAVAQGAQGCDPFRLWRRFRLRYCGRSGRGILLSGHSSKLSSRTFSHLSDHGNQREGPEMSSIEFFVAAGVRTVYFQRQFPQAGWVTDLQLPGRFDPR